MLALMCSSFAIQAQDFSLSTGWAQSMEFIGDDIKDGIAINFAVDFDAFKKSNFNLGPSLDVYWLGEISSDVESIDKTGFFGAGINTGFDIGRTTLKGKYLLPVPEPNRNENVFFTSIASGQVEYKLTKDGFVALMVGGDYFFNRNLFHYTYQIKTGITLKF